MWRRFGGWWGGWGWRDKARGGPPPISRDRLFVVFSTENRAPLTSRPEQTVLSGSAREAISRERALRHLCDAPHGGVFLTSPFLSFLSLPLQGLGRMMLPCPKPTHPLPLEGNGRRAFASSPSLTPLAITHHGMNAAAATSPNPPHQTPNTHTAPQHGGPHVGRA